MKPVKNMTDHELLFGSSESEWRKHIVASIGALLGLMSELKDEDLSPRFLEFKTMALAHMDQEEASQFDEMLGEYKERYPGTEEILSLLIGRGKR
jgi:hypothetical protein